MESPGQSIRHYRIRQHIAATTAAAVYRAQPQGESREVALKAIHAQCASQAAFVRRFAAEIEAINQIDHPHLLPVEDSWRDPGGAFLVTRWLPATLIQRTQESAWSLNQVAQVLRQVGSALHTAHEHRLTHGSVKPTNILLDEDENAYLTDFGIAATADQCATPYCAPEQRQGAAPTPQTDIYCLGVVVRQLLDNPARRKASTKPLREDVTALSDVLAVATAESPSARYPDVPAFVAAFHDAAGIPFPPGADALNGFTAREQEILALLGAGLSNAEIATRLSLASSTIKWYLKQIFARLNVHNRVQALNRMHELRLDRTASGPADNRESGKGEPLPPSVTRPHNPYKGLRAFQEADARDFFGRETLVESLVARLNEDHPLRNFLAVVGPSGSGKSSVVRAGLLPALRKGAVAGSGLWFVTEMMPGARPLDALELALLRVSGSSTADVRTHLDRDAYGLDRAVRLILPENGHLFLMIDQFEEVFLLTDQAEARRFLALLYTAVTAPHSPLHLVITLRADFYDRPLMIPNFSELLRQRTEAVVPLTALEVERAIVAPAERVGSRVEPRLLAALVHDVAEQLGSLPFLQFTLTDLFENRVGDTLTLEAYERLGKIQGVLGKRADDVFQALSPTQQAAARQCWLRLISLGEGTEDTRRRVLIAELASVTHDDETLQTILDAFGTARLLTFDREADTRAPTVEVAHEALIYAWMRLRLWLDEGRADIRQQRMLAAAAGEWERAGRDAGYLLSGTRLLQYEAWSAQTDLSLSESEQVFLAASTAERLRLERIEADRKAREARMERRVQQFVRALAIGATLAAVIGLALALIAMDRERQARREAAVNRSLVLANAAAELQVADGAGYGLPLALEAVNMESPPAAAISVLQEIAHAAGTRVILRERGLRSTALGFSADSRFGITGGCANEVKDICTQGEIVRWETQTGRMVQRLVGHAGRVIAVAAWADGTKMISAAEDGRLIVWDAVTGAPIREAISPAGAFADFAFSADGTRAVSVSPDGALHTWDVEAGIATPLALDITQPAQHVAMSRDGRLVTFDDGQIILVWDIERGALRSRLEGHRDGISVMSFRPLEDGDFTLLSASPDVRMIEWDLESGAIRREYMQGSDLTSIAVGPDGRQAVLIQWVNARLFDLEHWGEQERISERSMGDTLSRFSPDGRYLLIANSEGGLRICEMPESLEIRRFGGDTPQIGLDVSLDGRYVLTGSYADGEATLWDAATGQEIRRFPVQNPTAIVVRFSPDGRLAALASSGTLEGSPANGLIVVEVETGRVVYQLADPAIMPRSMSFSPDGRYLLLGSLAWGTSYARVGAGDLTLWDMQTGALVRQFDEHQAVMSMYFSPDSRQVVTTTAEYGGEIPGLYGYLKVWEVPSGNLLHKVVNWPLIHYPSGTVWDVNGRDLLVGGFGYLTRYDLEQAATIQRYGGLYGGTVAVAQSQDGRYVAAGEWAAPSRLMVWDAATGVRILNATPHNSPIWAVVFHPDGRSLFIATSSGGPVIQWRVPEQSLDQVRAWTLANRYVRPLTCEERAQYSIEPLCKVGQ